MIILASVLILGLYGAYLAYRRKGNAMDVVQYGAGFALLGLILGVALTIGISRAG